ncbi:MAG: hypothetical protein LUQ50_08450 [Methanospirillum sp.]|uniref:hypothetical protein n=1 Tax=Methanospirillum sp. TaxID=45200 RepID=UPI002371456C|nr:hypothetical protein [Methanospirillum sp.]MDD1729086.1 hypothetical protein [Methanospirillum sp.]
MPYDLFLKVTGSSTHEVTDGPGQNKTAGNNTTITTPQQIPTLHISANATQNKTDTVVISKESTAQNATPNTTQLDNSQISIPYERLLKEADAVKGTNYNVSGYVSQAVDTTDYVKANGMGTDGQGVELWVNYDDFKSGGNSTPQMIQLYMIDKPLGRPVTQGDRITVNCVALSLFTYEGSDGTTHTIPGAGVTTGKFN